MGKYYTLSKCECSAAQKINICNGIDVSADTFQGCRKTSEKMWFCRNSDAAGIKVCCKRKRILYTVSDGSAGWNASLFKCMCKMRSTNIWQFCKKRRETCF